VPAATDRIGSVSSTMANCVQCGRKLGGFSFDKKICPWCRQHEAAQRGESDDAIQRVEAPPWLRRQSSSMAITQILLGVNVAVFLATVNFWSPSEQTSANTLSEANIGGS
jgi:hypothetical protein